MEVDGSAVFVQPFNPPLRLAIVGAVHIAQALVRMAPVMGFEVTLIDPRGAWTREARFPELDRARVSEAWPDAALEELAPDHRTALGLAAVHRPQYAVIDLRLEGERGLEVLKDLVERLPALRAVVLTGYGSVATAVEAIKLGAHHYLTKPCDPDALEEAFYRDVAGDPQPAFNDFLTVRRAFAQALLQDVHRRRCQEHSD